MLGRQFPADAAGSAGPGASGAAVDGLRDGGVVARAAVPGAGDAAGTVAAGVLGERGRGPYGIVAAGGRRGTGGCGAGAWVGIGVGGIDGSSVVIVIRAADLCGSFFLIGNTVWVLPLGVG